MLRKLLHPDVVLSLETRTSWPTFPSLHCCLFTHSKISNSLNADGIAIAVKLLNDVLSFFIYLGRYRMEFLAVRL